MSSPIAAAICAALCAIPATALAQAGSGHVIFVDDVRITIPSSTKLGSRKGGAFCLPARSLYLSDIQASTQELNEAAEQGLSDAGVPAKLKSDLPVAAALPAGSLIATARIESLAASVCERDPLLGRGGLVKGSGTMRVAWKIYDAASAAQVFAFETDTNFAVRTRILPSPVLAAAVKQSATELGRAYSSR